MKIIMIAVTSADGKLTQGDDPDIYKWTSQEDKDFFFKKRSEAKLIVMGSNTYSAASGKFNLKEEEKLRVVLTSNPDKYREDQIPGVLEFTSESPEELVARVSDYQEMLLLGGSQIFSSFAKRELIDEIYLTIEPIIFGKGKSLFSQEILNIGLSLESAENLNENGTLLLKYKFIK